MTDVSESKHAGADNPGDRTWVKRADPSSTAPRQARVDRLLGEAERIKRRDYDRLKSLAEEAYELACQPDENGDQYRYGMASSLALFGHLSSVLGESHAALQQCSQALALLDSHEPSAVLGHIYLTMGWAHYQTGDYVRALHALLTAQHIAEKTADRSLMAYAMDRIANVYHSTDKAKLALDLQERAIAIHRELGDTTGEAFVSNNMSYTYLDLGRYDDALRSSLAALEWAEREEKLYVLMGVLDTVAEVYRRKGDLESAAAYSQRGLELAHKHRSEPDRGDAMLTMARIELERGNPDLALTAACGALEIAHRAGRSIEEFTCHELLSSIQEARGELGSALDHYRRYHELERIRVNEETSARLADLQIEHEVDSARKNAEIHRLRSIALQREVEQRRIAQTELEAQASLDPLTGLFNRRHVPVLAEDLVRSLAQDRPASLILFDIDRFKEINDNHGHFAGDQALAAIARLLRDNARETDTPVRYGGDEFLVLLEGAGINRARDMAERLRLAIAHLPVEHQGGIIHLTVSMGVATAIPGTRIDMEQLIERADRMLYAAKHAGRNCVVADVS